MPPFENYEIANNEVARDGQDVCKSLPQVELDRAQGLT